MTAVRAVSAAQAVSAVRAGAACLVLAALAWALAGCGSVMSLRTLPEPFEPDLAYGSIVREIRVEGAEHTRESLILEALASKVGEPYTRESAHDDQLQVRRLNVFSGVSFDTEPRDDGVTLVVRVTESSPILPSLSVGITQENGLEVGPAVTMANLGGRARRLSGYARVGGSTNYGATISDPPLPHVNWGAGKTISYENRTRDNELDSFQEHTKELRLEFQQPVAGPLVRMGGRLNYLVLSSNEPGIAISGDGEDRTAGVGAFVQYDTRNALIPTSGFWAELAVTKYGIQGTDGDWWRGELDVRRYSPLNLLGPRHSITAYGLATLQSGTVGTDIPIYSDYSIGGTNSVRGWPQGSRTGKDQVLVTGEYWFQAMREREFRIWFVRMPVGLQVAAFADAGTVWNKGPEFQGNWIGGGGIGFRLTLPVVTVVRFDLGFGERGYDARFYIGGSEKATAQRWRVR